MHKYLLGLLGIIVISVVITFAYISSKGKLTTFSGLKEIAFKEPDKSNIDKLDPKWLKNYCNKEVKNLPEAPFKHRGLDGDVHHYSIPDIFLNTIIPTNKWFETQACGLWYKFDKKEAYASVGVEDGIDIRLTNAFEENIDRLLSQAIDKSWKKISPLSDKEGGRPNYSYAGFPMIFTRENKDLSTVEFATMTFGGNNFYVNFIVYEK